MSERRSPGTPGAINTVTTRRGTPPGRILTPTGTAAARGGSDRVLEMFSNLLYQTAGIVNDERKRHLLKTKMDRLLSRKGIGSYEEYWDLINTPGNHADLQEFFDMMTTNTTEFFRENNHFVYIQNNFNTIMQHNPRIQRNREVVIWSAASSSGQEPVTLALVMLELLGEKYGVRILATDLDTQILTKAIRGAYSPPEVEGIPPKLLSKYFSRVGEEYLTVDRVRSVITYRQFNLMHDFKFRHGFDMIFCRNVMIYFDNTTQETLVNKFYEQLVPGGMLFMGHSESMVNKQHRYRPVAPAIWLK